MINFKRNSGFTIIETLFSLVIFLILFFAISSLTITAAINAYRARYDYEAANLAQKRLEELKFSSEFEEGVYYNQIDNYVLEEEIRNIEEYNGKVYKITVKVYKNEELLETMESIKVMNN